MRYKNIPIKIRDELSTIETQAIKIESAMSNLNRRFEKLSEYLRDATSDNYELNPIEQHEDIQRILKLNHQLTILQEFLHQQELLLCSILETKVSNANDPMVDYEIEAQIAYVLRKDDPEYDEEDDNFLTHRTINLKRCNQFQPDDWRIFVPGLEKINSEPHSWLFHDLHDHCYGLSQPNISLEDCTRIGKVWIDVISRHQYSFNLDTGELEKQF